jgi:hypothetical protein
MIRIQPLPFIPPARINMITSHSVSSLTRLTRFRPSVWLPRSWVATSGAVASLLHRPPYSALREAGHHWLSVLLAHLNPGTAHSVSSLTRLTRFRPSVWLPRSWVATSGAVASLLHRPPYSALTYQVPRNFFSNFSTIFGYSTP